MAEDRIQKAIALSKKKEVEPLAKDDGINIGGFFTNLFRFSPDTSKDFKPEGFDSTRKDLIKVDTPNVQRMKTLLNIPEEKKPLFFKKLKELKGERLESKKIENKDVTEEIQHQLSLLSADNRKKVKDLYEKELKTKPRKLALDQKFDIVRNKIMKIKFSQLPNDVQSFAKEHVKANPDMTPEEQREFVGNILAVPQSAMSSIASKLSGKDPFTVNSFLTRLSDAWSSGQISLSKNQPVITQKKLDEIRELVKSDSLSSETKAMLKQQPELEKIINSNLEAKDFGVEQGNIVSLLLGSLIREGQAIAGTTTTFAKALFSEDKELQKRYLDLTDGLVRDATNGSIWLPPKASVDDMDVFRDIFVPKDTRFFDTSVFDSKKDTVTKALLNTSNMLVDPQKYIKDYFLTQFSIAAGFLKSLMVPTSLVGSEALKVGKGELKISKVVSKTSPIARANMSKVLEGIKKLEVDVMTKAQKIVPFGADDIDAAVKYVEEADLINKSLPEAQRIAEITEGALDFRKMQRKLNAAKKVRDKLISADTKLKASQEAGNDFLLNQEARLLSDQVSDLSNKFARIADIEDSISYVDPNFNVFVRDGMQSVSKEGSKLLKELRKGTPLYSDMLSKQADLALAKRAFKDPSLIDKGGVKIFGLEVPGTSFVENSIKKISKKIPVINRFPGAVPGFEHRANDLYMELGGRTKYHQSLVKGMRQGISNDEAIRLSFVIETGADPKVLDNTRKINSYGTLRDIYKAYKGETDKIWKEGKEETDKFRLILKRRGLSSEQIKNIMENQGGDLAGSYVANYQTISLKNEKLRNSMKKKADLHRRFALQKEARGEALNDFDRFTLGRSFDDRIQAIKVGLPKSEQDLVDRLVSDIVTGSNVSENIKKLTKISKKGLNPDLNAFDLLGMRYMSADNAIAKHRFNVDVAQEFGLPVSYSEYFLDSGLVAAKEGKFKGMAMPEEILRFINTIDSPTWKESLAAKGGAGPLAALKLLKGIDLANNWFKRAVTTVFPKFHTRNAAGNVAMNFMDIGIKSMDTSLHLKSAQLVASMNKRGAGKNMIFRNKYGQVLKGDELLTAAKKNNVFVNLGDIAEVNGSKKFYNDNILSRGLKATPEAIENQARLLNFIANWENGHSFGEAALRGRKFLVDYGNMTNSEREVLNRVIPFYQFGKQNFINVFETLLKNPKRILQPARFGVEATGAQIQAPPESVGGFFPGEQSAFFQPKDGVQRQLTSIGSTIEDVDRVGKFITGLYEGLFANDELSREQAQRKVIRHGFDEIMPLFRLPIVVMDDVMGGAIFKDRKLNSTIAEYMKNIPRSYRRMVGLDFNQDRVTGDTIVEYSPVSNIMFTMMGGSRFLSTAQGLTKDESDVIDKVSRLILPMSTRSHSIEEGIARKKLFQSKAGKARSAAVKKILKTEGVDFKLANEPTKKK